MTRIYTLFYQIGKMVGFSKNKKADEFLNQGLKNEFEPSKQSVSQIMAFASAYHYEKTENIGDVDCILN